MHRGGTQGGVQGKVVGDGREAGRDVTTASILAAGTQASSGGAARQTILTGFQRPNGERISDGSDLFPGVGLLVRLVGLVIRICVVIGLLVVLTTGWGSIILVLRPVLHIVAGARVGLIRPLIWLVGLLVLGLLLLWRFRWRWRVRRGLVAAAMPQHHLADRKHVVLGGDPAAGQGGVGSGGLRHDDVGPVAGDVVLPAQ